MTPTRRRRQRRALTTAPPDDDDARRVGGANERVAVEDRASGPRRSTARRRRPRCIAVDRRDADDRHVEPHVLLRLRDLDDARARAGQRARARDRRIGAFHAFDGHDRAILHDDRLADVEAGDRVRDRGSRTRSPPASRRSAARCVSTPGRATQIREQRRRVHQRDAVLLQHVGHGRDQRVRVLRLAACVSTDSIVRSGITPPNSLTCLTWPAMTACDDAAAFSVLMHLPSWPSSIQVNVVPPSSRASVSSVGKRLALDRHDDDVVAELAGGAQHEKRKRAVAGDQANRPRLVRLLDVHQILEPPRRPPEDDAALRGRDEVDEVADLRARRASDRARSARARGSCCAARAGGRPGAACRSAPARSRGAPGRSR